MKKQLLFALVLLLVVLVITACDPGPSAPAPVVPTPAQGQEQVKATTPVIEATATLVSTATSTLTLTPSVTPSLTATKLPASTPVPKWQTTQLMPDGSRLPAFKGRVVSFQNDLLRVEVEPGKTFDVTVSNSTSVYAGAGGMDQVTSSAQILALTSAVKETALVTVAYRDTTPTTATMVTLTLSKESATVIPTLPPQTLIASWNATRAYATLTATPPGFQATSTPALAHRIAEFPWGKVDLDVSMEQANEYSRALWCMQSAKWIPPEKFSLYATQPQAMVSGVMGGGYFHNVEILSRDAAWKSTPKGDRHFQAIGLIRNTQDRNDTRKISLTIFEGAPILVFFPMDARAMGGFGVQNTGNGKEQTFIDKNAVPASTQFAVTDLNQIRIGQTYGIFESADLYHHPSRELIYEFTASKSDPWIFQPGAYSAPPYHALVTYTQPFDWLGTCDHFVKDLGLKFDPNEWRW